LFELISGLNPADRGDIFLEDAPIHRLPAHAICHLGIARVFQSNAGFDTLSAQDNVLIAAAYGPVRKAVPPLLYSRSIRDRAEAALHFVGLTSRGDTAVRNLSVLERKLLMVATAMATEPKLLLMDEPVGGLNPEEIDKIMKLVESLVEGGMTIMLIEHVMRFLVALSDRVMIMHHGEKIYEGAATGLAQDETVKSVYLGEKMSRRVAEYARPGGVR
jgi:branched-chain amino acid transport system ATP-binding protein